MTRITFALTVLVLFVPAASGQMRPNIVLMMADDLGWGDTGFNGNRVIKTPNLDQMSREGITFTRFYAASSVCSPTRGACLTGRHPYRYGVYTANKGHLPLKRFAWRRCCASRAMPPATLASGIWGPCRLTIPAKGRAASPR